MKQISNKTRVILQSRNICFLLYFLILLVERSLGGILGIFLGEEESMIYSTSFIPKLVHPLTLIALLLGIVVMSKEWLPLIKGATGQEYEPNLKPLAGGIGFFLLSGMLHTGFLILPLQFAAYGFLLIGYILHEIVKFTYLTGREKAMALTYIICFSMTIPVVYDTKLENPLGLSFIIVELVTVLYLIFIFSYMSYVLLKTGKCNYNPTVLFLMLLLVGTTFFLRWDEYQNWLVAVFAVLTLLTFIVNLFINRKSVRLTLNPLDCKVK